MKLLHSLTAAFVLLASAGFSAAPQTLWVQSVVNAAKVDSVSLSKIQDILLTRLAINKGWVLVDKSQLAAAGIPADCDRDCMLLNAPKVKASYAMTTLIEAGDAPGSLTLHATLTDAADGRDLQAETLEMGSNPDLEQNRIGTFAKLFDPATIAPDQTTADKADRLPDDVSTSAQWVLSGTAVMVLGIVLFSLLQR